MTVETLNSFTDWVAADGSNKNWSYDFTVFSETTVYIEYKDGADGEVIRTQADLNFVPDSDFVGGTIVYPATAAALEATYFVRVVREVPYTQPDAIGNEGAFYPENHERAFDRLVMQTQQLAVDASRALKTPLGELGGILVADVLEDEVLVSDGANGIKGSGSSAADIADAVAAAEAAVVAAAAQVVLAQEQVALAQDEVAAAAAQVVLAQAQVVLATAEKDAAILAKEAAEAAQAAAEAAASSADTRVVTSIAELKALPTAGLRVAILLHNDRHGIFTLQLGDYSALVAADTEEGIYVEADDLDPSEGALVRQLNGYIRPEWFGAVGYPVGTDGYATAPDDYVSLQAAIDAAIRHSTELRLVDKWYRHNTRLDAIPQRSYPHLGEIPGVDLWGLVNAPQLVMRSYGNAGLIAGAAMAQQVYVHWDNVTPPSSIQPSWCEIAYVKFNGNNLVTNSNLYLHWSAESYVHDCGFTQAPRGIRCTASGLAFISHNDIHSSSICIDLAEGGDSIVKDNDLFVESVGISCDANVQISGNTINGANFVDGQADTRFAVVIGSGGYGIDIHNNEIFGIDCAVYGTASDASVFNALQFCRITNNHVFNSASQSAFSCDVQLAVLAYMRGVIIANNQVNDAARGVSQKRYIELTSCFDALIHHNVLSNTSVQTIFLTSCVNCIVDHNVLNNASAILNMAAGSEALNASPWVATNVTVVPGTTTAIPAGSVLAKNGATLMRVHNGVANAVHQLAQPVTVTAGQPFTFTGFFKADDASKIVLFPYTAGTGAVFDLAAGTVGAVDASCSAAIKAMANGVYRCSVTLQSAPGTTANPGFGILNAAGTASYAGTSIGVYAGGFQFQTWYVANSYNAATAGTLAAQPAPIVLSSCTGTIVRDNIDSVGRIYPAAVGGIFVNEAGASSNNLVANNTTPRAAQFNRVSATSTYIQSHRQALEVYADNGIRSLLGPIGYSTGAGGAVTQLTSRTTGVTVNKPSGQITMFSAAGSTTAATFTVTNSVVEAGDVIVPSQKSGTNLYDLMITAVAAGSFNITFRTTGGTAVDAPVINFAVIKAVAT